MSYHREIHNVRTHIATLRIALVAVTVLAVFMGWGWHNAPRDLTVHIPPDLRSGSLQPAHEVPQANVYAFAYYIWQQMNRWPENGQEDYGRNLFRLSAYLTPALPPDAWPPQCRSRSRTVWSWWTAPVGSSARTSAGSFLARRRRFWNA